MDKIILIGGGGHCKSCIDVIEAENKFEIIGILDIKEKIGQKVSGYLINGTDAQIERFITDDCYFLITLGQIKTPDLRVKIFEKLKKLNAQMATVISPLAYVSKNAEIGEGTIIMHQALVNAGAKIGKNCIINTKALIEHDAVVENYCHISTGAILNGETLIREKSFIGSNATLVQCIELPASSFIKAGSLVK